MRIAFIGLGNMGAPMAERLATGGFDVSVHDADPALRDRFATAFRPGAAEAASDADVVVTMLPNGSIVRDALLGEGGALAAAPAGAIVIDMSSSDASQTVALGEALAARGHPLIDAPVSGGVPMAAAGTLSLMVGTNDDAALARAMPVLERLGVKIARMGVLGSGHATKAINNAIAAATLAVTAEGMVLGERFGIAPDTLLEAINASTGRSGVAETVFRTQIVPRKFAQGFALALMAKDVGLADSLRERLSLDLPMLEQTRRRWDEARDTLAPGADFTAFFQYVEGHSGTDRK